MIPYLLNHELVDRLGLSLLHFLWQGTLIALVVALGNVALKSARTRHTMALFGLVAMLAAPVVTFQSADRTTIQTPATNAESTLPQQPNQLASSRAETSTPGTHSAVVTTESEWNWRGMVAMLWMLGVISLVWRVPQGWFQLRRLRRESQAVEDSSVLEALRRAANAIGVFRAVELLTHAATRTPVTFGWVTPVILLSPATLAGLSPAQLEAILAHELAHIRRHDYLISLLQAFVESLLFFHPAVWWISREVSRERELAADDLVVDSLDNRVTYAKALANIAESNVLPAPAASDGLLMNRVRRILTGDAVSNSSNQRIWVGTTLSLAMLVTGTVIVAEAKSNLVAAEVARLSSDSIESKEDGVSSPRLLRDGDIDLAGRVIDMNGRPIAGAKVQMRSGEGSKLVKKDMRTDVDGRFMFSGLGDSGVATVIARSQGYGSGFLQVDLLADETVQTPDFKLRTADKSIAGRVVDLAGNPVAGVKVHSWGYRQPPQSTITEADGRFRIAGLIDDWLWVQAAEHKLANSRFERVRVRAGSDAVLVPEMTTVKVEAQPRSLLGQTAPPLKASHWYNSEGLSPGTRGKVRVIQFIAVNSDLRFFRDAFPWSETYRNEHPDIEVLVAHGPFPKQEVDERLAVVHPNFKGIMAIESKDQPMSQAFGIKHALAVVIDQGGKVVFEGGRGPAMRKAHELVTGKDS